MPWYWEQRTPIGWVVAKGYGQPMEKGAEGVTRKIRNLTWIKEDIPLDEARAQLQSSA